MERQLRELDGFGHVHRRQHEMAVVAMPAAARRLVIVALRASHVQHDQRQVRQCDLCQ